MRKIMAAVDFSDSTDDVINMARDMAKAFDAEVLVVHTHAPSPVLLYYYGVNGPLYIAQESDQEIKEDESTLNILKFKLEKAGVHADCKLLRGPTVENIIETAQEFKAELIIAGCHKHGALYNFFVGSISEKVMHKSTCPIMVVPHLGKKKQK